MPDPDQLVINLTLLRRKLQIIGERLPFASSADAEMLAERLQTAVGLFIYLYDAPFEKGFLLARDANIDDIAGNRELHEDHHPVRSMRDGLALGGNGLNGQVLKYDIQFFSHLANIGRKIEFKGDCPALIHTT